MFLDVIVMEINRPITVKDLFFNKSDDLAAGRRILVGHNVLASVTELLSTGVFYTAFLLEIGIDVASISVLAFMPFLAAFFSLISPGVLIRFSKRRWVLFCGRLLSNVLKIGGILLLPLLTASQTARVAGFCVLLFLSSMIDAIFNPGYLDWHINFLPERTRAKYFSVILLLNNLVPNVISIGIGLLADTLRDTPAYHSAIYAVRILALVLAAADCVLLLLPKEFSYDRTDEKPKIADIFRIPLRNARFAKTMGIYAFYYFIVSINSGVLSAYFMKELGMSITVISAVNAAFGVAIFLFSPLWQKVIGRFGWFRELMISSWLGVPIYLAFVFVSGGNAALWFPILRLIEHFPSVGRNIAVTNLLYINTPKENSIYYYAIATPIQCIGQLLGMMFGSLIVGLMGEGVLSVAGISTNYGQFLYLLQAVLYIGFAALLHFASRRLEPGREN